MKTKSYLILALVLVLGSLISGCAYNRVAYVTPEGGKATWTNARWSWKTESATGSVKTPSGTEVTFDVKNSSSDASTIEAAARGAAQGAVAAAGK